MNIDRVWSEAYFLYMHSLLVICFFNYKIVYVYASCSSDDLMGEWYRTSIVMWGTKKEKRTIMKNRHEKENKEDKPSPFLGRTVLMREISTYFFFLFFYLLHLFSLSVLFFIIILFKLRCYIFLYLYRTITFRFIALIFKYYLSFFFFFHSVTKEIYAIQAKMKMSMTFSLIRIYETIIIIYSLTYKQLRISQIDKN